MEEQNHQPLLVSNSIVGFEDHAKSDGCGPASAVTESVNSPRRGSCACNLPRQQQWQRCRQISVASGDSGIGVSLDPISETCDSETSTIDCVGRKYSQLTRAHSCCDAQACREQDCTSFSNPPQKDEFRMVIHEQRCERDQTKAKELFSGGYELRDPFLLQKSRMIGNGRLRTQSEGCAGYNCVHATGERVTGSDMFIQNHDSKTRKTNTETENTSDPESISGKSQFGRSQYKCLRTLARLSLFAAVCAIGLAIFIHQNQEYKLDEMKKKILELEEIVNRTSHPPVTPAASLLQAKMKDEQDRPRIHLVMNGRNPARVSDWNAKVLQWISHGEGGSGMRYDERSSAIVIQETGAYFVYNQVYAFRVSSDQESGKKDITNQTIIHTIYRRPFNFPESSKPRSVAESALSHCWNKDANTQVHASYQGLIVNMRKNEQLLVGLDHYDESFDKLNPSATFFGVFKL